MLSLSILRSSRKLLAAAVGALRSRAIEDGGTVESAGCASAKVNDLVHSQRYAVILNNLSQESGIIIESILCFESELENLIKSDDPVRNFVFNISSDGGVVESVACLTTDINNLEIL